MLEREKMLDEINILYNELTRLKYLLNHAKDKTKVRTGEWINYYQDGICHFVGTCSVCGNRNDIPPIESAHYCPSCGAKMKGAEE